MRGKPADCCMMRGMAKDHPRRCGENCQNPQPEPRKTGSPPQVRGKRHDYAEARYWRRDHPRRCGENGGFAVFDIRRSGITPAGAGKTLLFCLRSWRRCWITPAGAGKTRYLCRLHAAAADHPRRCGENCSMSIAKLYNKGSPPQVRGKQNKHFKRARDSRITPAGAGKTALDAVP